jgi:hypothetical protein
MALTMLPQWGEKEDVSRNDEVQNGKEGQSFLKGGE